MSKSRQKRINIKKLLFIGFFITTQSTIAAELQCKKDYDPIISQSIVKFSTAFNTGDLQYIEDKTHPSLIEDLGGKDTFKEVLTMTFNTLKDRVFVSNVESMPPQENYIFGSNEFCFIPTKMTLELNKKTITSESFLLGVRPVTSKEWTFLDGKGLKKHPNALYTFFPEFPKDIKVPLLNN